MLDLSCGMNSYVTHVPIAYVQTTNFCLPYTFLLLQLKQIDLSFVIEEDICFYKKENKVISFPVCQMDY